jgi:hypothetical protein
MMIWLRSRFVARSRTYRSKSLAALHRHAPMMRQTSAEIGQAGNVWSINNSEPDFDIDVASNPGGDGIVIFVGLAAPPVQAH